MGEDTAGLLREIASYRDRAPEDARMPPPEVYLSEELYEIEMDQVFRHEWICVGREEQLPEPGDFFTIQILEEPIVVVRGRDRELRALSNVCRHRYMKVAEDSGNARFFLCPYHKWSYNLDGKLRSAPGMEGNRTFDAGHCALPQFRLETWQGFVFVSLDEEISPLHERLRSASERCAEYDLGAWKTTAWYDEVWNGNWKLSCENGMDSYHHMGLHETTAEPCMPGLGTYFAEAHDHWNYHRTPILPDRALELGYDLKRLGDKMGLREEDRACMNAVFIYPNLIFPVTPWSSTWLSVLPIDRTHSRIISGWSVPQAYLDDVDEEALRVESSEGLDKLNAEDAQGTWRLQSVLDSRKIQRGPIGAKERAVFHFWRYMAGMLSASA